MRPSPSAPPSLPRFAPHALARRYDAAVTNRPRATQRSRKARRLERSRTVVTVDDVRSIASALPRSYEVMVHGRVKFRVGQLVYVSFSRDQTIMGFGFPKELRDA